MATGSGVLLAPQLKLERGAADGEGSGGADAGLWPALPGRGEAAFGLAAPAGDASGAASMQ